MPMNLASDDFNLSEEVCQVLFRFSKHPNLIIGQNMKILKENNAARRLTGYSQNDLVGMDISTLLGIELRELIPKKFFEANGECHNYSCIGYIIRKDGKRISGELTFAVIPLDELFLFHMTFRDKDYIVQTTAIMNERHIELEKQGSHPIEEFSPSNEDAVEREVRYRNLVESSLQGILIIEGPPYNISFSNPAVGDIFGYTKEELLNMTPAEFLNLIHWTDRNSVLSAFQSVLQSEKNTCRIEARFNQKSDSIIWLDLSITSMTERETPSLLITAIDITRKRKALADLTDSAKDLELYGSLLRHDLKNDLQVIIGNADVIRLSAPRNEIVQQFAEASITGAERMLDLLKIFGKPDMKTSKNIASMLERISVEAAQLHVGMKCMLHIETEVLMVRVIGGRMLSMVFRNLINNSAKYAGKNAKVEIRAERKENFIDIQFSDDGPGIAEEVRTRLFSKGVSTSGGGLGLYLSRKIVEAYGGSLELVDPGGEDKGAIFLVRLAIT